MMKSFSKYYNQIFKEAKKYAGISRPVIEISPENPDILPAYAHDTGNYVARYGLGNFQIQFVIKLDGRLDFDMLSRAVRLSVDAEPVLGCRFVEHDPPYWKRLENIDQVEFCSMEDAEDAEKAINQFLESPLDMDKDPMIKVKLIRSGEYDTLGVKINHTCSDGVGAKEYIHLLSHIYCCLDSEDGVYEPKPSIRSRRDHEKAFDALGIKHPEFANSPVESPRTVWPFPWKQGAQKETTTFVICRLPDGMLDVMSKYGKEKGATINDLILTSLYRAMFKLTQPPYGVPMDIGLTVDLRRYLPGNKAEAIRNFAGGIVLRIPRIMREPFEETLLRIAAVMNRKKERNPGYQCVTSAEHAERINFHQAAAYAEFMSKVSKITSQNCFYCSPGLSNMGLLSRSLIQFGKNTATEAYIIPPVVRKPGLMLVASSYNGILTLAAGYYQGSVSRKPIEKLLDKMRNELVEGCTTEVKHE